MNRIEGEDDDEDEDDAAAGCYPHWANRHSRGPFIGLMLLLVKRV